MLSWPPGFAGVGALAVFLGCGLYVHLRGRVRRPLVRQLLSFATLMAPVNCLMYAFSAVPNRPYIDLARFPDLQTFADHWQTIRDEARSLDAVAGIRASDKLDDLGFNSFFRSGWKRFYLRWYGTTVKSAEVLCPKTVELLQSLPRVKGAMFALLPPGARLVKHRDPYAGSLRYHLGLMTPNSDDCCICVDGEKYAWRDGEAVMFDETFIHYAENKTDINRIILFIDVERPSRLFLVDWINRLFGRIVMAAAVSKNVEGDRVGGLNRIFGALYQVRLLGKRIKRYNRALYYSLKYALLGVLIYVIFL